MKVTVPSLRGGSTLKGCFAENRRSNLMTICFLIMATMYFVPSALACPGCSEILQFGKDALGSMRFGKGIAWSMLLMFLVPFLLVGGMETNLVVSTNVEVLKEELAYKMMAVVLLPQEIVVIHKHNDK